MGMESSLLIQMVQTLMYMHAATRSCESAAEDPGTNGEQAEWRLIYHSETAIPPS